MEVVGRDPVVLIYISHPLEQHPQKHRSQRINPTTPKQILPFLSLFLNKQMTASHYDLLFFYIM